VERRGYIIVGNEHDLFPAETVQNTEKRAADVLSEIERQHKIKLPPINFALHTLPTGYLNAAGVVRRHFKKGPLPEVRIIFSAEHIDGRALQEPFTECDLLVVVQETSRGLPIRFDKSESPVPTCYVFTHDDRSARVIEDIIIDVTLGNFFRLSSGPIADVVRQNCLKGLYTRKVAFALEQRISSETVTVDPDARYVTFSSLGTASDDDIRSRAEEAYATWQGLSHFLSALSLKPTSKQTLENIVPSPKVGASAFKCLRKIGGQLPLRRIQNVVSRLSDGRYVMIVLRTSVQVGKTPNFRNQIKPLFGQKARINDFVIYGADSFFNAKKLIDKLSRAGHVYVVQFGMKSGNVVLEPTG